MYTWCRDIVRAAVYEGPHIKQVQMGQRHGMISKYQYSRSGERSTNGHWFIKVTIHHLFAQFKGSPLLVRGILIEE
jgi:hypothetical protein